MNLNNSLKSNIIFLTLLMIIFVSLSFPLFINADVGQAEYLQAEERRLKATGSGGSTGSGGTRGTGFGGGETIEIANPLVAKTIPNLIDRITNFLVYIASPIVVLMIFWGAFQIMTAGGEPEKAITGRRTITYTVVGYILLLIAKGVTTIIANVLGIK